MIDAGDLLDLNLPVLGLKGAPFYIKILFFFSNRISRIFLEFQNPRVSFFSENLDMGQTFSVAAFVEPRIVVIFFSIRQVDPKSIFRIPASLICLIFSDH